MLGLRRPPAPPKYIRDLLWSRRTTPVAGICAECRIYPYAGPTQVMRTPIQFPPTRTDGTVLVRTYVYVSLCLCGSFRVPFVFDYDPIKAPNRHHVNTQNRNSLKFVFEVLFSVENCAVFHKLVDETLRFRIARSLAMRTLWGQFLYAQISRS